MHIRKKIKSNAYFLWWYPSYFWLEICPCIFRVSCWPLRLESSFCSHPFGGPQLVFGRQQVVLGTKELVWQEGKARAEATGLSESKQPWLSKIYINKLKKQIIIPIFSNHFYQKNYLFLFIGITVKKFPKVECLKL